MNEITTMLEEANITFGQAKWLFYEYLYNLGVSFPNATIYLATADVTACFRFPRIHLDLTGAFGFYAGGYYCLAPAMVFGSNTSATIWEPFRRAIEALTVVFANHFDLVTKHNSTWTWSPGTSRRTRHQRQFVRLPGNWIQEFWVTNEMWRKVSACGSTLVVSFSFLCSWEIVQMRA